MSDMDASKFWLDALKWDENGMIPAIAQEATSGRVVMFAWMNREALQETLRCGCAVYWSRSRQRLWRKGEESGHVQRICSIRADCDGDALLLSIDQVGGMACHGLVAQRLRGGELTRRVPAQASCQNWRSG